MSWKKLSAGTKAPEEVNALIEISMNASPVKYEFDKETGILCVDRFMPSSMIYPCNYGFIPSTLSGDGDPLDVLVYTNLPVEPVSMIKVKPIGVLLTEDESGEDEKILAVPTKKIDPFFLDVHSFKDLPAIVIERIEHFFEHYKKLEPGKWVKVKGWRSAEHAKEVIALAIKNFEDAEDKKSTI